MRRCVCARVCVGGGGERGQGGSSGVCGCVYAVPTVFRYFLKNYCIFKDYICFRVHSMMSVVFVLSLISECGTVSCRKLSK